MRNDGDSAWSSKLATWLATCGLLAACFSANKPIDSTQTGNPPIIEGDRLTLTVSHSEVHVIGRAGSVAPGGATVEVTNLSTGKVSSVAAEADGSFDVLVGGSLNDAFSVRAKSGDAYSSAVYVIRGTAAVGDGQDGSLSCAQRNTLAGQLLKQAAASADRSCSVDSDCQAVVARASCYAPDCGYEFVSQAGRSEIEQVGTDIESGLCADYEKDSCEHALPKCAAAANPVCTMGQCAPSAETETDPPADCAVCLPDAIGWSYLSDIGYSGSDYSQIRPCAHYTRMSAELPDAGPARACEADLRACDGAANSGALAAALANADVQAALRGPEVVNFGQQGRNVNDPGREGLSSMFLVGDTQVVIGNPCPSDATDCTPTPAGVQALMDLLRQIDKLEESGPCASFAE